MASITLRFLAEPTAGADGKISGGTVMKWIDEAGYACASHWAKRTCLMVFLGSIRFHRPILPSDLVEVEARLACTGHTSMNLSIEVRSGHPKDGLLDKITDCLAVFVAVDEHGWPMPIDTYTPQTPGEMALAEHVRAYMAASRAAERR